MRNNYIQVETPNPYTLPTKFFVQVEFPRSIYHEGKWFFFTGKLGIRNADKVPAAEYEYEGELVCMTANEEIYKD